MSSQGATKRSIHYVISEFINRHQEAFLKLKLPQQITLDIPAQSWYKIVDIDIYLSNF